jgi:acyl-[acyl-carrier-protein]-phospholipid O-acyltransferase/long-chain-fatty-acid--[acyl-carrier-protein] ligase
VLAVNTPMAYRSGTVGQFLPAIDYRLVPVAGIAQGGMLHVKGPNLMSGYLRFEAPGQLIPPRSEAGEGWYETGDVVGVDADGFVSIVGRVKRFAKIAGEMISLEVVEKLALQAAAGASHAATTQADGARGEAIVLFTEDRKLTRDMLVATAGRLGVPEIAVPRKIVPVDSLPLLGTGKTDYVMLKRWAETA